MLKLNLGCSLDLKDGYVNIDIFDHPQVTKIDVRNLNYKHGEVDEIFAKDVLEHLPYKEAISCINNWCKLLKKGGVIKIQTICLNLFLEALNNKIWDVDALNYMLFAGVNWAGNPVNDYDFHKCIFSEERLINCLRGNGVELVSFSRDSLDDLKLNPYTHNLNMFMTGVKL